MVIRVIDCTNLLLLLFYILFYILFHIILYYYKIISNIRNKFKHVINNDE